MGKNSSGPTMGKTCVVILRNSCFFLLIVISLALLYVQAHNVWGLEFRQN